MISRIWNLELIIGYWPNTVCYGIYLFCNLDKIFKIFHFSLFDLRFFFKLVRARRRRQPIRMNLRRHQPIGDLFCAVIKRHKNVTKFLKMSPIYDFCDQHQWRTISFTFLTRWKIINPWKGKSSSSNKKSILSFVWVIILTSFRWVTILNHHHDISDLQVRTDRYFLANLLR